MGGEKILVVDDGARIPERIVRALTERGEKADLVDRTPKVLGTAAEARLLGLRGVVVCAGCKSSSGTLVGKTFRCNTGGCEYQRKALRPFGDTPRHLKVMVEKVDSGGKKILVEDPNP